MTRPNSITFHDCKNYLLKMVKLITRNPIKTTIFQKFNTNLENRTNMIDKNHLININKNRKYLR